MNRILIIQTAFIGDVILASVLLEKLHQYFPSAKIDFLLCKGNESLLENHPFLNELFIWDKKKSKYKNMYQIIKKVRKNKYDKLINVQRFMSSGIFTLFSGAKKTIGFDKNPFSFFFSTKVKHEFKENWHETQRNLSLIENITDNQPIKPKLYPAQKHFDEINQYQNQAYICVAPTSVWFTKQFAFEKWVDFLKIVPKKYQIYLLGAKNDVTFCEKLINDSQNTNIINLAGKISLLGSAALMKSAVMNYVNDSAPMHLCSAVNAPTCAIYCSTITDFGYFPLSDKSFVIEETQKLFCRPCGIHGHKKCPFGHFKCAFDIDIQKMIDLIV
ncbi:MAG: glycosyltransferase family 9 protein [Bacteroidetes bacterium]|nr:MAG: glycosyltransferase family 9 protein [Bacteroidota bacterium]TAG85677.1 MAG: glycosyltransferase family 9 protein [Bacteroidota bacterium]